MQAYTSMNFDIG